MINFLFLFFDLENKLNRTKWLTTLQRIKFCSDNQIIWFYVVISQTKLKKNYLKPDMPR